MKKEKKFKLSDDQKQVVALFKSTVEEYAASGVYGTFCGFNEDTTKSDYRISAELDSGRYKAFVTYSPTVLLENHFFDVVFKFGTDREYTIYVPTFLGHETNGFFASHAHVITICACHVDICVVRECVYLQMLDKCPDPYGNVPAVDRKYYSQPFRGFEMVMELLLHDSIGYAGH